MSFDKRIITSDSLLHAFKDGGMVKVERLFQSDAIILSGPNQEMLSKIRESLVMLDLEQTHKLVQELSIM
jgi:hypothetical protein